ncbi:hypothetical protein BDQ17DRAFT_1351390, partial [Cyathus striatus]
MHLCRLPIIVLSMGPDTTSPSAGCADFLKHRFEEVKLLLCVCTGSIAIAQTGILDGLQVCSKTLQKMDFRGGG